MASHRMPGRPRLFVCPPSGEKVLEALDASDAPLAPGELQKAAGLPRRTMYFALECLGRLGLVHAGTSLRDTRRRRYVIDDEHRDGAWRPCFQDGDCA